MNKENNFIELTEEEKESYSDDAIYNITSWGADFSFREICSMYADGDLIKPELQRKYVWTTLEASRFIESILLGLPVPSIFFAKQQDNKMLIVDGFQRIMSVYDYMKGSFSDTKKEFSLTNSETINKRWRGKSFIQLSDDDQRKIRTTTIHTILFQQIHPENDTAMYQIFERINTGGRTLTPQEIRNCVSQGVFNTLIMDLNKDETWRKIFGKSEEHLRMNDIELILRMFAMIDIKKSEYFKLSAIPLKKYLNEYMEKYRNANESQLRKFSDDFKKITEYLFENLGTATFRKLSSDGESFANSVNGPVLDAISLATHNYLNLTGEIPKEDLTLQKYKELLGNQEFLDATSVRSTNINQIKKRTNIASKILYGVEYEW